MNIHTTGISGSSIANIHLFKIMSNCFPVQSRNILSNTNVLQFPTIFYLPYVLALSNHKLCQHSGYKIVFMVVIFFFLPSQLRLSIFMLFKGTFHLYLTCILNLVLVRVLKNDMVNYHSYISQHLFRFQVKQNEFMST